MKRRLSERTIDLLSKYPDMFQPFLSGEDLTVRGLAHDLDSIELGYHFRPTIEINYSIDKDREDCYVVIYQYTDNGSAYALSNTLEKALYNCLQNVSYSFEAYKEYLDKYLDELNSEPKELS